MPTLMKIATVNFPADAKAGTLTFEADPNMRVKCWANAPFRSELTVGAEAEAVFETMAGKPKNDGSGNWPDEKFLKGWGGAQAGQRRPFGSGGSGGGPRGITPEQFTLEKRSILASVALKEAREFCQPGDQTADVLNYADDFYDWLTKKAGI